MTNERLVIKIKAQENVTENLEKLYIKNIGLIRKASQIYRGLEDSEDLAQEGYFGLVRAVELWDPEQDVKFTTYSFYWIRQAMANYICNCGALIRIPANQRQRINQYKRAANSIRVRFGRDPRKAEIMALLGISAEQYDCLLSDVQALQIGSTSKPIGENGEETIESVIPSESNEADDIIEKIELEELARALWDQVDQLPELEATVIRNRFTDGLTLEQCGNNLGITKESAKNLEDSAFRKLRKPNVTKRLRPYLTDSTAYSIGILGGLHSFRNTGASTQERAVMILEDKTGPVWKYDQFD